ncbi:MAG: helix-turn-helix domain-containing protein [Acidobacteriota bacterium]
MSQRFFESLPVSESHEGGGTRRRNFRQEVRDFERRLICEALKSTGGNQAKAARMLGLRPTTLSSLIQRLQIDVKPFRAVPSNIPYEAFKKLYLWRSNRP